MKLYGFDGIDEALDLLPLSARRALDLAGIKLSLEGFRLLTLEDRRALCLEGEASTPDLEQVAALSRRAEPQATRLTPVEDPDPSAPSAELVAAFTHCGPLPDKVWQNLSRLDRYALWKVVQRGKPKRIAGAYLEIVGQSALSTHLRPEGGVHMVSVSEKSATRRRAVAESWVTMSTDAFSRLRDASAPKGDVLGTARLAGIMATKRTSDLIPLCHPLSLSHAEVSFEEQDGRLRVLCTAEVVAPTGVEMEAMVGASTAALTVYDMLKGIDRAMSLGPTRLIEKTGGRSGTFTADSPEKRAKTSSPQHPMSLYAIRSTPLDLDEALAAVGSDEVGGIDIFIGVVRDHNEGREVTLLEYEAYAEMAVKQMEKIGAGVEAEVPGVRLAAIHRVGSLKVGDRAIICAAASPHRGEAFRACRLLIDRIKADVPVWKREHGPDGPYWVGWQDARCHGHDHDHKENAAPEPDHGH